MVVIGHWSLVIGYWLLVTCTEFQLRGNRAKSRFNYRVVAGVASPKVVLVIHKGQRTND
ncbi:MULTISPECIES: hypothetical protein [unclassified Nostoc]|uniref:hypothetical protein n=1 Tax=unclassified Nostoc TaxID=2593658 RepID=UPI002AD37441|nr:MULTISPECIES: hypothetical protein [unclassified Nostoc]MDZ8094689.1 hypothetical protein [Nostoc sp. DedQUE05]MDZ8128561.1 hypothetical protein [Nostoc sp. DedQUE07]